MFEYFILLFEVASSPLSSAQASYNKNIFFSFFYQMMISKMLHHLLMQKICWNSLCWVICNYWTLDVSSLHKGLMYYRWFNSCPSLKFFLESNLISKIWRVKLGCLWNNLYMSYSLYWKHIPHETNDCLIILHLWSYGN
jgi:hypothetical protein